MHRKKMNRAGFSVCDPAKKCRPLHAEFPETPYALYRGSSFQGHTVEKVSQCLVLLPPFFSDCKMIFEAMPLHSYKKSKNMKRIIKKL